LADWLDFAVITASVLAFAHAASPWIRTHLGPHALKVRSFGGGVGLAYVFLALFPEIDLAHDWLGHHVHLVTLVSFLLFYVFEWRLILMARSQRQELPSEPNDGHEGSQAVAFWFHIGILAIYTSLVMFTLPERVSGDLFFALTGGLAIGLHCVYKDYLLRTRVENQYQTAGRYLLALAPIVGWLAHRLFEPSEAVLDLGMAVLAGVLIQSVFRDEIPEPEGAAVGWVFAGVVTFALLSYIS